MDNPDFYISSITEETGDWAKTRACRIMAKLRYKLNNQLMLIEVEPPTEQDIRLIIISPRFEGYTLFPINEWPCHVYILRILDEQIIKNMEITDRNQFTIESWGEIYRTLQDVPKNP